MNSVDGNSSVRRRTFSIRQIQSLIESPWLFRWQTLLPYSLVGVLLGYASEVFRLSQRSVVTGLAVSALSVSLTTALIVGVGFALRSVRRNRVPIVFGSLIAVGVCRATIVTAVVDELSLNRESFLVSRIILSSGSVPIVLLVVAFIVSTSCRRAARGAGGPAQVAPCAARSPRLGVSASFASSLYTIPAVK